jgi:hypothetical protein
MLSGLSPDAADCYRRAAECQELARLATNDTDRGFYLEREKDWLLLAQTHQLAEGFDLAIEEIDRQRGVTLTPACPACKKETPVHYRTLFVCTNCKLIFEAG